MKDFDDIEIADSIIEGFERDREMMEQIREFEETVLEHSDNELERMLVRAVHFGHDFMDVRVDGAGNVEYEGWDEGHEPPYDFFDEPLERFDLRDVTYEDIHKAHAENR